MTQTNHLIASVKIV